MENPEKQTRSVRRTDLMFLPNIGSAVRDTLTTAGVPEERWAEVCANGISARCMNCEETVAGPEWAAWLLAIGAGESGSGGAMHLVRLRQGCCANLSCHARFYDLIFEPDPVVDWSSVSISGLEAKEEAKPPSIVGIAGEAAKESVAKQLTKRTLTATAVFLALWMFRQWYTGGEIPILQPAKDYTGEYAPVLDYQKEVER